MRPAPGGAARPLVRRLTFRRVARPAVAKGAEPRQTTTPAALVRSLYEQTRTLRDTAEHKYEKALTLHAGLQRALGAIEDRWREFYEGKFHLSIQAEGAGGRARKAEDHFLTLRQLATVANSLAKANQALRNCGADECGSAYFETQTPQLDEDLDLPVRASTPASLLRLEARPWLTRLHERISADFAPHIATIPTDVLVMTLYSFAKSDELEDLDAVNAEDAADEGEAQERKAVLRPLVADRLRVAHQREAGELVDHQPLKPGELVQIVGACSQLQYCDVEFCEAARRYIESRSYFPLSFSFRDLADLCKSVLGVRFAMDASSDQQNDRLQHAQSEMLAAVWFPVLANEKAIRGAKAMDVPDVLRASAVLLPDVVLRQDFVSDGDSPRVTLFQGTIRRVLQLAKAQTSGTKIVPRDLAKTALAAAEMEESFRGLHRSHIGMQTSDLC
eukprot:g1836.t1